MTEQQKKELMNDPEVLAAVNVFIRKGLTPPMLREVFEAFAQEIKQ